LALHWEDVDFGRGALTVTRSVDTHYSPPLWGTTKTGAGRTIRLPQSVENVFRHHAESQSGGEDLVFTNGSGELLRRNLLTWYFKRHLKEARLPSIRFHDLRHTAATLMLRAGVPIPTASHILGHANPMQTLSRYAHVLDDMHEAAAERMDSLPF